MYASGYLKDDANPLTYFITWDENNNNNNKNNKKMNEQRNKQNKTIRFDSTLEVNNTHFNNK